jgi:hypothetical protein
MHCDVCGGRLLKGIALNSATRDGTLGAYCPANHSNLAFIPVAKCEDCGRSLDEREFNEKSLTTP